MLKFTFLALVGIFLFCDVKSQQRDSSVFYYQYDNLNAHEVSTLDSADYYRVVLLPNSGENLYTSREFYKNGQTKLVGKFDLKSNHSIKQVSINFLDDVVEYYPNGKKQFITHYNDSGYKEGNQYVFYPNGLVYCCLKNHTEDSYFVKSTYWECYDAKGIMICAEGNGRWITYDKDLKSLWLVAKLKMG